MTGNRNEARLAGATLLAVALSACAATRADPPVDSAMTAATEPGLVLTEEEQRNARDLGSFENEVAAIAAARAAGPMPGRITLANLPDRLIIIGDDGRVTRAYYSVRSVSYGGSSAPSRPPPPPK